MNDDFRDLLDCLLRAGARFLVVGARAMAVHGVPRATGDLDVWPNRTLHAVGPLDVPFLGREDLMRNKRASGRSKDVADLEILEGRGEE